MVMTHKKKQGVKKKDRGDTRVNLGKRIAGKRAAGRRGGKGKEKWDPKHPSNGDQSPE